MSDQATLIERRRPYRGRVVDLRVDRVRMPNGRETEIEVIRHPGAAAIVPVDAEGRVLLVRQYRYATGEWLLEIPAGKLDPGEAPEACAARELEEETGFRAGRLEPMGWIWTTPGFSDERIWLFVATELEASRPSLQPDEVLSVEARPLAEAVDAAAAGEIRDGKTVCGLLRAARRAGL